MNVFNSHSDFLYVLRTTTAATSIIFHKVATWFAAYPLMSCFFNNHTVGIALMPQRERGKEGKKEEEKERTL